MMEAAQKRVLLLDHHKFDRVALHALAELSAFDAVIVSKGLDPERQDALRNANVRLQIADWAEQAPAGS
jgi:DeoR/GlpR family transcriptional regulator of sugar metabolism